MVCTFYPPYHFGGDATYVRALSRALVEQGHEVDVVHCEDAYRTGNHSEDLLDTADEGITVHRLKSRFGILSPLLTQQTGYPGFKSAALKKILNGNFDVVNFHNISLVGGPAVLSLSKAPVTLYTLHEHWLVCPAHIFWKNKSYGCDKPECFTCSLRSGIPPQLWRYTGLIKKSLKNVDSLLAPSQFTANKHRDAGIQNQISVLPLFSTLKPDNQSDVTSAVRPQFIFVGRVTASKGVIPLLKTFSKLAKVNLLVVGDGDLLESLSQEYAHCENILFKGAVKQSELVKLYQDATALILPSLAPETFGLTVVEAFACGTPAIVRAAGGSRDIVDATGAGFVYQTDAELEFYVSKLANDIGLRKELGQKALQGFQKYYTVEKHLDNYLTHIKNIQKQKGVSVH